MKSQAHWKALQGSAIGDVIAINATHVLQYREVRRDAYRGLIPSAD